MSDTELTVSHPVYVKLELAGLDFNGLLREVWEAVIRAAGELVGRVLREVEQRAIQREPGRWENRGQLTRRLELPWGGTVEVRRTRVRDGRTGRTYNLADRLVGWRPRVRRGVWQVRSACELAAELSYRRARYWWQRLTGGRCSVMGFWRMVQEAGERLVQQDRLGVGEIRPEDPVPQAVRRLYLEADGVWLRRQRRRRRREGAASPVRSPESPAGMLVYAGASYSRLSQTAPGRWNAVDKQVCVELGDLRAFGRQWAWQVSRRFDLPRTPNVLYLCDGEDGLLRLPRRHFRSALVQLDRFHVHRHLGRAFGLQTAGYRRALTALCSGALGEVRSLLALRGAGPRRQVCQEVRTYLDRHERWLHTHREWCRRTTVNKMGSGVIEKTVETHLVRRMKGQGMSWSAAGARRLSKLRVRYLDSASWEAFWARYPQT